MVQAQTISEKEEKFVLTLHLALLYRLAARLPIPIPAINGNLPILPLL
jgi:hypothetical protein